jgi:hypothetical protein
VRRTEDDAIRVHLRQLAGRGAVIQRGDPAAMASAILEKVKDDEMPPAAAWGDGIGPNGKKLLERWLADGAPR